MQSAGRSVFQTLFGLAGLHPAGLLLGETTGRFLGMSRMLQGAWPVLREHLRTFRIAQLLRAMWRHRKFPLYSLPSSFLDALCLAAPVPLLVRLYGASVGGHYALVWRAITVPSALITVAVADTFHSRLAVCARETPQLIWRLFGWTSLGLLLVGSIPSIALLFWGGTLFRFAFGPQWALAGAMASLLAPWYLSHFVVSPVTRVVVVLSGQELKLFRDVLCCAALLSVFFFAEKQGLPPLQTVRILSIASAVLDLVYFLVLIQIIARFHRVQELQTVTIASCAP